MNSSKEPSRSGLAERESVEEREVEEVEVGREPSAWVDVAGPLAEGAAVTGPLVVGVSTVVAGAAGALVEGPGTAAALLLAAS
jgi:hypothetical protein